VTYATPDSDALFLLLGTSGDGDRADALIAQAEVLAASIKDPLPDGAETVILSAAMRAYANPQGVTSETISGMYAVTRPMAGVYLTKTERATLRRMAGGGGAFTIDPLADYATRFDS
jgi:hypothetical protein